MTQLQAPAARPARIGIDAMALAVPDAYLDLRDLASARGVAPGKYTEGLLVDEMSIAAAHEDTVALAARAARRALELGGIDVQRIGLCVTGTETAVDHSKPIAT
jgi:hydroxymethylglutaryl-CoA synthase